MNEGHGDIWGTLVVDGLAEAARASAKPRQMPGVSSRGAPNPEMLSTGLAPTT